MGEEESEVKVLNAPRLNNAVEALELALSIANEAAGIQTTDKQFSRQVEAMLFLGGQASVIWTDAQFIKRALAWINKKRMDGQKAKPGVRSR